MIEGIELSKRFEGRVLFENFNFKIESGEFVCFSGVSGCGKTTLLNMIGMIEPFDSGKLLIDGEAIVTPKQRMQYFQKKLGFLFQNFALVENKTVEQNLKLIRKQDRTNLTMEEALKRVGLSGVLKQKVYTLSGGEQQRVALARLFFKQSEIILADEPTGSLDEANANRIMQILKELHQEGKTIILVTHDEKIKRMAERVIEL
ncbi:ATP-binding cassette domain-containing protein [Turicibacter sp. 1E2]|uniref:Bacteriocin ABC transporter ATP-binding protein n=1 Tax=Turicibacter faecis TaxID=2963365 RepID=A0ABM8IN45_9FIRM|nr:ATP-binding cassette domain-containing protein [Turicibacter sp. 1E2]MCU7209351.1 ATP-binding cassette domain-containing protein [Turicibacter sp. 1E2]BEH91180.1 bacteriocin ABC transporter ATP-binding protein [Turicibacter sp. TC023]